jgi:hypothetical protein
MQANSAHPIPGFAAGARTADRSVCLARS